MLVKLMNIEFYITSTILGELYYGAYRSGRVVENLKRIEVFKQRCQTLACDAQTAQEYGRLRQALAAKGRPIPENDIWIAAIALQYGLPLVMRDQHFQVVDGLVLQLW